MAEPNPYEPSKTPQPLRPAKFVKRGLGVALILVLTPPAMVVTVMGSCTAAKSAFNSLQMLVALGMPLAVLTGLMVWAMALDRPRPDDPNRKSSRAGIFLATPAVVAVAMIVGFVFAAAMVLLPRTLRRYEWALENAAYFFWLPPAVALLAMLTIAWRAGPHSLTAGRTARRPEARR